MKPIILALLVLTGAVRGLGDVLKVPPASPDLSRRYVFYLHGGVVTGSDGRPFTKEFGPYEYRAILKRFSDDGFVVISEIRPDDDDPGRYAGKVAGWISQLKKSGVSSSRISVVGASMGGVIAAHVSALLGDPGISYVILAGLYDDEPERSLVLHGRLLSIYDGADTHRIVPDAYFRHSPLTESRSIVTKTGRGHGLIYTIDPAWYDAALDWISGPN
jgi:pimeloyl-ACP methyl ester carboxylesterase